MDLQSMYENPNDLIIYHDRELKHKIEKFMSNCCVNCKIENVFRDKNKNSCEIANQLFILKFFDGNNLYFDEFNNIKCKRYESCT